LIAVEVDASRCYGMEVWGEGVLHARDGCLSSSVGRIEKLCKIQAAKTGERGGRCFGRHRLGGVLRLFVSQSGRLNNLTTSPTEYTAMCGLFGVILIRKNSML
jgi:hypothetical protein